LNEWRQSISAGLPVIIEGEPLSAPAERLSDMERMVLAIVAAVATIYWAACSLLIHRSFHSNGWDLGLAHQVLWNSSYGRVFEYSFRDISYAGDHWQPFLLVLVPVEAVFHDAEVLLIVQAMALAVAIVPLYASARCLGLTTLVSGAFVAAYVLSLGVVQAVSFDFHIEVFAPLFAFTAIWALGAEKRWLFVVTLALILTLKEDGALLTIALSWVGWFAFRQRAALPMAGIAIVYMLFATSVIIPQFRGNDLNPFRERFGYLGDSPAGVAWGALTHPGLVVEQLIRSEVLEAMAIVLAAAAFLPLRTPRLLPALALVTLLPLLSKEPGQGALLLHYLLVPSVVALVIGLTTARDLSKRYTPEVGARRVLPAAAAALMLFPVTLCALRSPLPPSFEADMARFDVDEHARLAQSFIEDIPPHASVSAQSPFVPHLSARAQVFQFPRLAESFYVLLDEKAPVPSEDQEAGFEECSAALPQLGYVVIRQEDGISLWHRVRDPQPQSGVPDRCGGRLY
jgi:uncharacterized membrane protein